MGIVATFFPQQKVSTFTLLLTGIMTIVIALWVFLWRGMAAELRLIGRNYRRRSRSCSARWPRCVRKNANKKLLLQLLWVLPLLAFIPLWISLQPFWDKGGGFF